MKKIVLSVFTFMLALLLVACGGGKEVTATGYGLVHKSYVGEVTVTVKKDKVTKVQVEEYYLLDVFGEVNESEAENVLAFGGKFYAKYMLVDGKLWTANEVDEKLVYKNAEGVSIVDYVKNEANAKGFVEALKADKVFIVDSAEATEKSTVLVHNKADRKIDKRADGYWPETHPVGIGWLANITAFEEALVAYGVDATFTKGEEFWETGDNVTGATMSDFLDYQAVAKRALANTK